MHTPSLLLIVICLLPLFGWAGGGYYYRNYYGGFRGYGIGWIVLLIVICILLFR